MMCKNKYFNLTAETLKSLENIDIQSEKSYHMTNNNGVISTEVGKEEKGKLFI